MKEEFLKENNLCQLDEVTMNRIMSKYMVDGFIIVSADRNEITDPAERNQRFKQIKYDTTNFGYPFIPIWGGYREVARDDNGDPIKDENGQDKMIDGDEPERALLIPNNKALSSTPRDEDKQIFELGKMLSEKYQQETFLYKPMGDDYNCYYIKPNGDIDRTFNNLDVNNVVKDFFTKMFHYKKDRKFDPNDPKNKGKTDKADKRFTFLEPHETPNRFSNKTTDNVSNKRTELVEIFAHYGPRNGSEAYSRFGEHFILPKK